jgi:dTDP-4-dehydrorhamnose reductase
VGETIDADAETVISPTYVPDLARAALDLLIDGENGIWHVAGADATTWADLARAAAAATALQARVRDVPAPCRPAARPASSALGSCRGTLLGSLDLALHRYARERPARRLHELSRATRKHA